MANTSEPVGYRGLEDRDLKTCIVMAIILNNGYGSTLI